MNWPSRIYRATLGRRRQLYDDLSEEIRQHLEEKTEQFQREGMSRADAEQAARRAFGNASLIEEHSREVWLWPKIENLLRDLRSSARLLRKSPGFTLVAVITLTLGIGANTAIFSLIDGLLLRPLPVPHADRLVVLKHRENFNHGFVHIYSTPAFSAPVVRALEKHHGALQEVAAYTGHKFQVRGNSGNIEVPGLMVSGQFFQMLQTPPLLGRYLTPVDDTPDSASNGYGVVISESFWRKWFNKAPDVVGRTLNIANVPFTVVGVMPARFIGVDPIKRPRLYVPLSAEPVIDAPYNNIKAGVYSEWLNVMGRLRSGVSLQEADTALKAASDQILEQVDTDHPGWVKSAIKAHHQFEAIPGSKGYSDLRDGFKKPLLAVFALCCVMLLLACLNLASLLMARSAARERELATRLAVGATRGRLIQQLLMDSLLLAALGAGIGLLVAPIVSQLLARFVLNKTQNGVLDTALDLRVLLFAVLIAFAAAIVVGLVPALRATSGNLNDWLKDRSRTAPARDRHRLWLRGLMGLEVALALILVIGCGLLATSLVRLYRTGLGFDPNGLVNLELSMDKQPLQGEALIHWYQQFGQALKRQPGVRNVSFEDHIPLSESMMAMMFRSPFNKGENILAVDNVAPNYFATMHIPLFAGREFRWTDKPDQGVVILNQAAAKALYPGKNPIGQQVTGVGHTYQVVGVAGDTKYMSVKEPARPEVYLPITQATAGKGSYTAVVRIDGPAAPLATEARSLLAKLAPDVPAPVMTTMNSELNESISSQRMMAMLSVFFAVIALLVTAIGLYGVLAYSTARRTNEIGVRMALGARRPQVVALVFRENLWSVLAGCAFGLAAALLAAHTLASFLYGISPRDPWVLSASLVLLCLVAAVASLIPALRAASIDPMEALRCE